MEKYKYLEDDPSVEVLYVNTDFGVENWEIFLAMFKLKYFYYKD